MPPLAFAGHDFQISGKAALFWPVERALIVADLHLEKASWFARYGQMLPPYDSLATLRTLDELVTATEAETVLCLGDNFHDEQGPDRLSGDARALLDRLTRILDWRWITGNHDEVLPEGIGGTIHDELTIRGLIFRHCAEPAELRPELSGHWHPKHRVVARGRAVSRPCFLRAPNKLILPAFGSMTGGLDVRDPAIRAVVGRTAEAMIPAGQRTLTFPLQG